jgi:hypothetical protein
MRLTSAIRCYDDTGIVSFGRGKMTFLVKCGVVFERLTAATAPADSVSRITSILGGTIGKAHRHGTKHWEANAA